MKELINDDKNTVKYSVEVNDDQTRSVVRLAQLDHSCDECDFRTKRKSNLRLHQKSMHEGVIYVTSVITR